MQISSFWPPRHARDRLASVYYQSRNPAAPWITRDAIELLPDLLKRSDRCLEWGSGKSTAWLSEKVGSIVSVEHDPAWFERVQLQLQQHGFDRESVRLLSIEPQDQPSATPYVRVIDEFGAGEIDVCFMDGEHRSVCTLEVLPKLASGGLFILDDAQAYLDHPSTSPHSRYGQGPLDADWARIGELLGSWRLVWTSDGYSDTAIWIKP